MPHSDIIRKIQNLFNLAEQAGTEEEAASAAAMAHKLLRKHDLEMTDVEVKAELENMTTEATDPFTRTYQWVWDIAASVSKLCSTEYFRQGRGWSFRMHFCGTSTDVMASQIMFRYLFVVIQEMGKAAKLPGIKERNSYCNGVGYRIKERVAELIAQEKSEAQEDREQGSALMVVKGKEVAAYVEQYGIRTVKPAATTGDDGAFLSGLVDGDQVSLNRPSETLEAK